VEDEESAAAAARLEAALERIAQRAQDRLRALEAAPAAANPDTTALAARLDGLIAQLREVLD
jgi:hypothetical protein